MTGPLASPPELTPLDVVRLKLSPLQRRIFDLLRRRRAIYPEALYNAIYGADPDGGPDPQTIDVVVAQMNRRLKGDRLVVRRFNKGKQGQPWILAEIPEAAE
jgi:hypothetical protein